MLPYIFPVSHFHIILIDHRIVQGGVNLDVTEQPLYLLYGHSFVNSIVANVRLNL